MIDIDCSILENNQVASSTFMLVLEYTKDISWRPGQFVMLRLAEGMDPFLRRPFSILGLHNERLEILYRTRGKATRMLSRMNKGEKLKVLGPLGNGFSEPQENDKVIYVAGGIG
ncbi:MAG TPA: dihydroorotate dehydrogenase electron transfer subunit, partial [Deltaproteobacteria bacterium]|nr:dihydroorotate dehydrogenase electron transfer subunit [Deltaproteobacteria bacterium]